MVMGPSGQQANKHRPEPRDADLGAVRKEGCQHGAQCAEECEAVGVTELTCRAGPRSHRATDAQGKERRCGEPGDCPGVARKVSRAKREERAKCKAPEKKRRYFAQWSIVAIAIAQQATMIPQPSGREPPALSGVDRSCHPPYAKVNQKTIAT
jgi:hypothetical protein